MELIKKLKSILKKRHTYVNVPDCPFCGSKKTGYYIYQSNSAKSIPFETAKHLLKGEYVCFSQMTQTADSPDFYCQSCGTEWNGDVSISFVSKEDMENERKKRGITDDLINKYINCKSDYKREKRRIKKQIKKANRKQK